MPRICRCVGCCFLSVILAIPAVTGAAEEVWQYLDGLGGAVVRDLERAPSDGNVLYAATWGDVYKSTDGGATWQVLGLAEPAAKVAVHPLDSSIVLVGTDFGRLARTVDGGANWIVQPPPDFTGGSISDVEFDPSSPDTAYAVVARSTFSAPILKSVDGGVTWTAASDGLETGAGENPTYQDVFTITPDPQDSSILYTVDDFGALYKSSDGAESWDRVPNIGLNQSGAVALAIDPADPSFFYANLLVGAVYRSENSGLQWAQSNTGMVAPFTLDFAFGPGDPPALYAATGAGVYRSDDRALSWSPVNEGADAAMGAVLVDPADAQHLQAGGLIGVFESTDGGASWVSTNAGLQHRFVSHLFTDRSATPAVLAATRSSVLHRSEDAGQTWPLFSVEGLLSGFITALAAAPSDPARLYLGSTSRRVFRSSDHGRSWTEVLPAGGNFERVNALAVHPSDPQTVYAALGGAFGHVRRSIDGGETWTVVNEGLPLGTVSSVGIARQDPSILFAGVFGAVYKSIDGAATWFELSGLPTQFAGFHTVVLDPRDPETVYALPRSGGIYRTLDGGETWQAIHSALPSPLINMLVVDPDDSAVLYAAPSFGGLYRSPDRGETWNAFHDGLPDPGANRINFNSLAVASSAPERRIYAGIFTPDLPSGVYVRSAPFPSLFADGFESGDLSTWSPASSP